MKTLRQACVPRSATFDPVRRDTVLGLSDLIEDRIARVSFLAEHAHSAVWRAAARGSADSLHVDLPDYRARRKDLTAVLRYPASIGIDHWRMDAAAARIAVGAVEKDHA